MESEGPLAAKRDRSNSDWLREQLTPFRDLNHWQVNVYAVCCVLCAVCCMLRLPPALPSPTPALALAVLPACLLYPLLFARGLVVCGLVIRGLVAALYCFLSECRVGLVVRVLVALVLLLLLLLFLFVL